MDFSFLDNLDDLSISYLHTNPIAKDYIKNVYSLNVIYKHFFLDSTAGENISPYQMVYLKDDGKVYVASSNTWDKSDVLGISLVNVPSGSKGFFFFRGRIPYNSNVVSPGSTWSWIPGSPLYLGSDGRPTSIPPTVGIRKRIGEAISSTEIMFYRETYAIGIN